MRNISAAMQRVIEGGLRRPAYKIYAWDPTAVTISAVVSAVGILSDPAPVDLTPYASELSWSDRQFAFTLVDPKALFHPDFGEYRKYLMDAAIVRLLEGDETVHEADWTVTFTGQVHGQIGWSKSRSGPKMTSRVTVFGRGETQAFKRRKVTSKEYTVGTDLGIALYDMCETFLGLTKNEMRIPFTLGRQFKHKVNQLSQVTPWDGISSLLEVVCYQPYFDGEGKLSYINKSLHRPSARLYENGERIVELNVPERSQDAINKVTVTFLDSQLERVDGPYQKLGQAQVTTGFFSMHEKLECWWSEDHKQRAIGTSMKVIKSVNSGLLPVGSERYTQVDEFHGQIDVDISVWVPILATVMLAEYLLAAKAPDRTSQTVVTVPGMGSTLIAPPMGGPVEGVITVNPTTLGQWTISVGRVLQAQALIGILLIMMSLGSAQYEVWGTPYDYAYLEKKSIAIEDGLDYWLENNLDIKNDFIGTHDQADIIAMTELIWQKCLGAPRKIAVADDPRLEIGDIIGLPDGRKVVITGMSKTIKRGEVSTLVLDGGKVFTA
ncbi:MAG: hypothetical protein PHX53_00130 [Syntrophales bacterium]|nr:hypothetical protein [Syntrophales bacterium]